MSEREGVPLPEVDAFACPGLFGPEDRREVEADAARYLAKLREPRTRARQARLHLPGQFGGQVEVEALGSLTIGGPAVQRDSLFRISSTTKPVTGAATMALVGEGFFDGADVGGILGLNRRTVRCAVTQAAVLAR